MNCRKALGIALLALSLLTSGRAAMAAGLVTVATSPLRFELNQGQLEERVRFLARGNGYGLYLTREGATLALQRKPGGTQSIVSMQLVGARSVEPIGDEPLEAKSNYFVGDDASKWRRDVTSYARVRYPALVPGVDLVYYASAARELEYDLQLAPGVDPAGLRLNLGGLKALQIAPNGDALLELPDGSLLRKRRPLAYQLDAQGQRSLVAARFRKLPGNQLGFVVGAHDAARQLIIDPTLSYSTYFGGSKFDEFFAVAADSAGNTFAVGYTTGTLYPTVAPTQAAYGGGASDAVICKLKADGTSFIYATYLGGNDTDRAYGVAVDGAGSAYVTGLTYSSNFPTLGAPQSTLGGGQDAFVAKLSPTGALVYSTYLGGSSDDWAQGIAVRPNGEAFVVGTTFSANFPHLSAFQGALGGTNDAFVSRLSAAGGTLLYSTFLGGSGAEYGQAITLDGAGNAIVVGQTGSTNFPTQSPLQPSFGGAVSDGFVSKLDLSGTALAYSTYLGGLSPDVATGVAQVAGAAIVVGYTSSFNFPNTTGAQAGQGGNGDAFVARINSGGTSLDFSTYLGGAGADSASAVALDANGFVYVTGQTASSNFPLQAPITGQASLQGGSDAFLAGFSQTGSRLYSSYLGGNGNDAGVGVAVGGATTLHLLGNTLSTNFPTQSGLFAGPIGPQDGFIARLPTLSLSPAPATPPTTSLLLAALLLGLGVIVLQQSRREKT